MKECKLCTRQFPTVRGRNIHVARCHKQPLSKMRATPRGGIVLRPADPPSQQQLKQPRNQSTATAVAYVSGRSQSMRAVNFADNGGNGTGNVAGDSSIGHGRGAGSGNCQQIDRTSSNGGERGRGGHVVHINPRFLNGQQAAIAGSVNRQQIDSTSSNGRERGRNGNTAADHGGQQHISGRSHSMRAVPLADNGGNGNVAAGRCTGQSGNRQQMDGTSSNGREQGPNDNNDGGGTKQRDNLAPCADNGGNVAGASGSGNSGGAGGAGGSDNRQRQQMDGTSSNGRKRQNDKGNHDDGGGIVGIHEAIEEDAGQEAANEAEDNGTLEGQIKRAKLRYYNTNIVESELRADLLRLKIARMKRKE